MSIYIAHRLKNASNALNVPSTVQKRHVFSVRRKQSICMSGSRHANCFRTSCMSLVEVRRP